MFMEMSGDLKADEILMYKSEKEKKKRVIKT